MCRTFQNTYFIVEHTPSPEIMLMKRKQEPIGNELCLVCEISWKACEAIGMAIPHSLEDHPFLLSQDGSRKYQRLPDTAFSDCQHKQNEELMQ